MSAQCGSFADVAGLPCQSALRLRTYIESVSQLVGYGPAAVANISILVEFSDITLGVLEADPRNEIDLDLRKIDGLFLILHELPKQFSRHVVCDRMAVVAASA